MNIPVAGGNPVQRSVVDHFAPRYVVFVPERKPPHRGDLNHLEADIPDHGARVHRVAVRIGSERLLALFHQRLRI